MAIQKRMPTVMGPQHKFSMVPSTTIERSVFDRSHALKTTFNAGYLVPVLVDEVLPGDTFHLSMTAFARLTTPIKPVMDNMYLESFFFFVPYRLVWTNFVKMMGEQTNPGDSISFTVPVISTGGDANYVYGSIYDYMGLPLQADVTSTYAHSSLPLRAYSLIYNQWFRDENLINNIGQIMGDGPDTSGSFGIQKRGKRHDYFTSCLPFLQKGTAQAVPLTGLATVKTQSSDIFTGAQQAMHVLATGGGGTGAFGFGASAGGLASYNATAFTPSGQWYPSNLAADLGSVPSALLVNDLRMSFQIQKLLERDARGGTRYTELVLSHFKVRSPDARLQRAEYLGGGSSPVTINPVVQTSASNTQPTAQGNLAGIGTVIAGGHGFVKSFTEHGILLGIVNVRADLTYQQGLERQWSRSTRYDFYWPALSHIGEQAVLNKEIYCKGVAADSQVFGYQERYAEYRYKPSRITGKFRSTQSGTVDIWHLSEKFASLPALNQTFIEDQTSSILDRVVAVNTEPDFYCDIWFKLICARPMPVFGVPGLIDHF